MAGKGSVELAKEDKTDRVWVRRSNGRDLSPVTTIHIQSISISSSFSSPSHHTLSLSAFPSSY